MLPLRGKHASETHLRGSGGRQDAVGFFATFVAGRERELVFFVVLPFLRAYKGTDDSGGSLQTGRKIVKAISGNSFFGTIEGVPVFGS